MPYVQPLPWTEFLTCPICTHSFGYYRRHPISLGCGHSVCRLCLASLYNQQCPFDQSPITVDHKNLPVNSALLRLASLRNGSENELPEIFHDIQPPSVRDFSEDDLRCFYVAKVCIERLAMHLRDAIGNAESALSRSMQRKLVTLINCQLMTEEGRLRAIRVSRCIGERAVIEMIMRQQKPMQLNSCLWAAVRGRGCQFLGPVLQEDVLRHLLGALAGGIALSRKSLVMQVVTSLKSEYSQASKTSVGHVVQLLYRASCFNVSKRECESSLMQLKDEFSTYDNLRQEHDAQIVQIAMEAGLRIPPDQWSNLLYGDQMHKSYMQSIIDRLQTAESFKQSIQELVLTLQRNGDMHEFENMRPHLQDLANIEISTERASSIAWRDVAKVLTAMQNVIEGFVDFEMRLRKQAEDRRLSHRNFNNMLSHSRSDLDSFRSEAEQQSLRVSRPVMHPSQMSSSHIRPQAPTTTHPAYRTNGNGSIVNMCPTADLRQRFEAPQQTQSAPAYRLLARPGQRNAYLRATASSASAQNLNRQNHYNINNNNTSGSLVSTPPPPGFEPLRSSPNSGSNSMNSPCSSSSTYSSSNSDSNTLGSSNYGRGNKTRSQLLQPNWLERRNTTVDMPRHQQSLHRMRYQQHQDQQQNQLGEQQQQQQQQQQYDNLTECATNGQLDDIIDQEAKDRRQMQVLQERFNRALNSAVYSKRAEQTTSGYDSNEKANDDVNEVNNNNTQNPNVSIWKTQIEQEKKLEINKSQQALHNAFFNSSLNSKAKSFSTHNENNMISSNDDSNYNPFETEKEQHDQDKGDGNPFKKPNFQTDFPKSETIDLSLPNITREKLRQIWQVPPEQPEAKTINEIWKPLPQKQTNYMGPLQYQQQQQQQQQQQSQQQKSQQQSPSSPQTAGQPSERKSLEEIFRRHQEQKQYELQPQRHEKLPVMSRASDHQSNFVPAQQSGDFAAGYNRHNSENANNRGNAVSTPTYQDWLTRRNYVCMEATYSKIADRYPNVGLGPWTQTHSHNQHQQQQAGNQLGRNNAALYRNHVQNNNNSNSNAVPLPHTAATAPVGQRQTFPATPEPSNLGLSALRLLGRYDEGFNPEVNFTPCPPSPRPAARKSALDAAIDTYWKDAMEASLGLNMFLPPAQTEERSSYPISEDHGTAQAMRFAMNLRDEFKQHCSSGESATTPTNPQ